MHDRCRSALVARPRDRWLIQHRPCPIEPAEPSGMVCPWRVDAAAWRPAPGGTAGAALISGLAEIGSTSTADGQLMTLGLSTVSTMEKCEDA